MKKQTAVEWLVEQLFKKSDIQYINGFDGLIEQAIAMEKEQIMKTFDDCGNWQYECKGSEDYYNKTYKK